jgi:hypothetical protein
MINNARYGNRGYDPGRFSAESSIAADWCPERMTADLCNAGLTFSMCCGMLAQSSSVPCPGPMSGIRWLFSVEDWLNMPDLFYRIRLFFFNIEVARRRRRFQRYMDKRKEDLAGADLSYLDLSRLDLRDADLREANLRRSDLSHTDLRRANLEGANLARTVLYEADLRDARLTGAEVTLLQLSQAKSLKGATMPDGRVHD